MSSSISDDDVNKLCDAIRLVEFVEKMTVNAKDDARCKEGGKDNGVLGKCFPRRGGGAVGEPWGPVSFSNIDLSHDGKPYVQAENRPNSTSTEPVEEEDEKEQKGVADSSYSNKIDDGQWDLFGGDVLVSSGVLSSIIKEDEVHLAYTQNQFTFAKERKGEEWAQFVWDGEEVWREGVSDSRRVERKRKRSEGRDFNTEYEYEDDVNKCEDTGLLEIIL